MFMLLQISVLGSFRYIPRSGMAGPKGRSIFNFLKYLCTAFQSGCTSRHPHQQYKGFPFLHVLLALSSTCLLICYDGHSDRCEVISRGFNLHFSDDIEHLFICLLTIYIFSLDKCLFRSFVYFLIWLGVFLVLSFVSTL